MNIFPGLWQQKYSITRSSSCDFQKFLKVVISLMEKEMATQSLHVKTHLRLLSSPSWFYFLFLLWIRTSLLYFVQFSISLFFVSHRIYPSQQYLFTKRQDYLLTFVYSTQELCLFSPFTNHIHWQFRLSFFKLHSECSQLEPPSHFHIPTSMYYISLFLVSYPDYC